MVNTSTLPTDLLHLNLDKDGHLANHLDWNALVAQQMAQQLGIELQAEQLQILNALRTFYTQFDHAPSSRPLIKYLQKQVNANISNASLMHSFKTGTVARTLAKLAGLPKPPNCL